MCSLSGVPASCFKPNKALSAHSHIHIYTCTCIVLENNVTIATLRIESQKKPHCMKTYVYALVWVFLLVSNCNFAQFGSLWIYLFSPYLFICFGLHFVQHIHIPLYLPLCSLNDQWNSSHAFYFSTEIDCSFLHSSYLVRLIFVVLRTSIFVCLLWSDDKWFRIKM